ncbi:hypothetical protein SESBI_40427 [Sesbania bispinosa]|nr:hypothetical protein SESBI_40427 [Sesbania bispinosa]
METRQQLSLPETETEEKLTIELDSNEIDSIQLAKRSLLCRIMAPKTLNKTATRNILLKAWGNQNDVQVTDLGTNTYIFTFIDTEIVKSILQAGPWFVMGFIASLQFWAPQASLNEIDYFKTSFWIQIHGLPLDTLTTSNAAKIAGKI